ncbi:MAG TPA: hypothetical protein DEG69_12190, partial [Flavobacteriaceae bacterium]|nr:hypothetical protein [Flavobacteriaceae bacterium]
IFDRIYPYEGSVKGFSSDFLLSGSGNMDFVQTRRYGGLYHNPNQAVRYVSVILAIFLIEVKKYAFFKQLPFLIIVLI